MHNCGVVFTEVLQTDGNTIQAVHDNHCSSGGVEVAFIFIPKIGQFPLRFGAETVTIEDPSMQRLAGSDGTLDLKIINILGRDGIPAILQPEFGN